MRPMPSQECEKEDFLLSAMRIRILLSCIQELNADPYQANQNQTNAVAPEQAFPRISDVGVSVGSFVLTGDTKAELIGVVIRRALQRIKSALLHLRECAGRSMKPPNVESCNGVDDSGYARSSAVHVSSSSILTGISSTVSRNQSQRTSPQPISLGMEDIGSLLNTLQHTMQAIKEDFRI